MSVLQAGSTKLAVTFPDEPLNTALTRMLDRNVGRLSVVERHDPKQIVGYLGRATILLARLKIHEEENVRQKGWAYQNIAKPKPA